MLTSAILVSNEEVPPLDDVAVAVAGPAGVNKKSPSRTAGSPSSSSLYRQLCCNWVPTTYSDCWKPWEPWPPRLLLLLLLLLLLHFFLNMLFTLHRSSVEVGTASPSVAKPVSSHWDGLEKAR